MSRRNSFTQAPVKLSVIVASLMASGCANFDLQYELNSLRDHIFKQETKSSSPKPKDIHPVSLTDITNEQIGDPKKILTDAANIALEEKKYGEALNYWSQLIAQYPDYADAYIGYSKTGRYINAHQRILSKLYDFKMRFPDNTEIMSEIAKVHYELQDYTQALEEIDTAIQLENWNWKLYSFRGVISSKLNYHSEAEASYAKALEISPNNPTVLNNLAASMIDSGRYDDAEFYATKAIDHPDAKPQIFRTYAKILALKGETERAEQFLTSRMGSNGEAQKIINSVSSQVSKPVLWGRR